MFGISLMIRTGFIPSIKQIKQKQQSSIGFKFGILFVTFNITCSNFQLTLAKCIKSAQPELNKIKRSTISIIFMCF